MNANTRVSRGVQDDAEAGKHFRYAFTYEVPHAFVELPDPSDDRGWTRALEELMPGSEEPARVITAEQMRAVLPMMAGINTVETGLCVGTDAGSLSMGFLVVSVQHTGHDSPLLAAEGIFRAKEQQYFAHDTATEDVDHELGKGTRGTQDLLLATRLPCGPAVTSVSMRSMTLPAGNSEVPPPVLAIGSLQMVIPTPREYCAYVTISTPTIYHLDAYSARLAHIARTFSLDVPNEQ
ncbi:hypothetical protein [Streptomyces sp. NPDC002845]